MTGAEFAYQIDDDYEIGIPQKRACQEFCVI